STARIDSRCAPIIEACLEEIRLARFGVSEFLDPIPSGDAFGTVTPLCLAFDRTGRILGRIDEEIGKEGVPPQGSTVPAYLATLRTTKGKDLHPSLFHVSLTIEHPAVLPARKRTKLRFHTQIP